MLSAMPLRAATERLYGTFAPYLPHVAAQGCECCVSEEERALLARVPLRLLSAEQLGRYAFKAMTTWGGVDDYKRFLPRILELATSRGEIELELVADKLQMAEWKEWPPSERAAVAAYGAALWATTLASDPEQSPFDAAEILPFAARFSDDSASVLSTWEGDGSLTAALQLAGVLRRFWPDIASGRALRGAWAGVDSAVFSRWLSATQRKQWLESAFERHIDDSRADRLAEAVDYYQWFTPPA
jgi:hypothetical protein